MCTRTLFVADDGRAVVGRNMDWAEDMRTDLWAFPPGMDRVGDDGTRSLTWTSRHASVAASVYGCASTDGVNDAGLVANILFLSESEFDTHGAAPTLSVAAWVQYLLDSCATVAEVVDAMQSGAFAIVAPTLPTAVLGDAKATVHLSVSDARGDSAVFEYVGGTLRVHHDASFRVMTNSPTFDRQLAVNAYWDDVGGDVMLPGTSRGADRFAGRATTSVCSRPTSTTAKRYYFQDTLTPNLLWVDLDRLALAEGGAARRLDLQGHPMLHGEVSAMFEPAEPFAFLGMNTRRT